MDYHARRGDIIARKLPAKINDARERHGCERLTHIDGLNAIATEYAETLTHADTFDHFQDGSPNDRAPEYIGVLENLYRRQPSGFDAERTATAAVQSWLNSKGHRENLLDTSVRLGGIGVATTTPRIYVVQMLADEKKATASLRDRVAALNPL